MSNSNLFPSVAPIIRLRTLFLVWGLLHALFLCNAGYAEDVLGEWKKVGGPIGGLGYNVRYRPDDPSVFFVTDAWSGLQRSTNWGMDWSGANEGIPAGWGPSSDAIPVFAFAIDPNDNDILWAGTTDGGGLFKSVDGGDSWVKTDNGIDLEPDPELPGITIRHIAVEPGNSSVVYVMGEIPTGKPGDEFERVRGFIYRSTDGGASFTMLREFASLTRWLFIDPNDTARLLLTSGIFDREADTDDPGFASGRGLGIFSTSDGGSNWSAANVGFDNKKSFFVGGAAVHPKDPATFVVATGNNNDLGQKGIPGAVYRSTDGGDNWTEVTPKVTPFGSETHRDSFTAVAFAPSDPSIVYVGSELAIYRSSDGGLTWTRYAGAGGAPYGPPGVRSGFPIDMVVDPNNPNVLYVNNYGGGVFKSSDGAQSWVSWSRGYTGADIHAVAVRPLPHHRRNIMANGRSGIFSSSNGGADWTGLGFGPAVLNEGVGCVYDPADSTGRTLLVADGHEGSILRSTNDGACWTSTLTFGSSGPGDRHGARDIVFAPGNSSIVYAGFMAAGLFADPHDFTYPESKGIYRSTDGGLSWSARNTGLPTGAQARNVAGIAVSHQDPNKLYIALREGGVYRSTNGGGSWTAVNGTLPDGESWEDIYEVQQPIRRSSILSVAVDPTDDETVYIGTNLFGIYKSTDGGGSWESILAPAKLIAPVGTSDHAHIMAIVIDPTDSKRLYAGEWHGGVYTSDDAGETWTQINSRLTTRAIADLAISGDGVMLYAATKGEGVFRYLAKPEPLAQEITFPSPDGRVFSSVKTTLSATSSSGLPVIFTIISGPGTISGNKVTVTGAGTIQIRATQAGDAKYDPAAPVIRSMVVRKASQTISFTLPSQRVLSKATTTLAATSSAGLPVTYAVVAGPGRIVDGKLSVSAPGRVTVRAICAANANYNAAPAVRSVMRVVDKTRPAVTIRRPKNKAKLDAGAVVIRGISSDNHRVARVQIKINKSRWLTASGTRSWSLKRNLKKGTYTIKVRAKDRSGNASVVRNMKITVR